VQLMKHSLASLVVCAACSGPLVAPRDQPADFDGSCASQGRRGCERACEDGEADACLVLANAYDVGGGVPASDATRNRWEERACALGSARGCAWLSRSLDQRGPGHDPERAAQLRGKACDGGDVSVCSGAAGDAFRDQDLELGFARTERSCAAEQWNGCAALGDLQHYGIGTPKSEAAAKESWTRACEHDVREACVNLEGNLVRLTAPLVTIRAGRTPNPPLDQIRRIGGRYQTETRLDFCVDGTGHTVEVEVAKPSSFRALVDLALATVEQWRFEVSFMPPEALVCSSIEFKFRND
jgi:hypothetical protein